jgi:7-keto-8-aminopelargonate synthetase-like enzyme
MIAQFDKQLSQTLEDIKSQGLYKTERVITTPQDAHIAITGGKRVLNMCANNYLGLADHPALIAAAKEALDTHGFGMASVRSSAAHRTFTRNWKPRFRNSSDRRNDPLSLLLRRQRRIVRNATKRTGCSD